MLTETVVRLPAPKEGEPPIVIDLGEVFIAESRQQEVAIVTPTKAPELLALFNKAWLEVDKAVKKLAAHEVTAEKEVGKRRAHMLLNEVKKILEQHGVGDTKDTRDAVIILDEKYQELQDVVDQIHATCEWLKGKRESFENSFTSVKKIMGEDTYNMAGRMPNPELKHGAPPAVRTDFRDTSRAATPAQETKAPASKLAGYGRSRY